MTPPQIAVLQLAHAEGLPLPAYETEGAAGADLRAALDDGEAITIAPGQTVMVPTGLKIALPDGFEGQVRPRSGLAARHGVTVLNSPGTIDADYRGEVKVMLVNLGPEPFRLERGERIAQLVIAPVVQAQFLIADNLPATVRGEGGFGSTGR
jgi:dUTP pyrophosphatase